MAHTFSSQAEFPSGVTLTSANPATGTFTCASGVTVLVLGLIYNTSTARAGGAPTYNGVPMTQAGVQQYAASSPECSSELWYLLSPPTGVQYLISVPNSGSARSLKLWLASFSAAGGSSSVLDMAVGGNNTSADPSVTVTGTVNGDAMFAVVADGLNAFTSTGTSGLALYTRDVGTWGGGCQYYLQSTASAFTLSWTASSEDWGECAVAFKEVTSTTFTVQESTHAHSCDAVSATQVFVLSVQDGTHAHLVDQPALTQTHILSINDTNHAHSADEVALQTPAIDLVVADSIHAHTSDNVNLTQTFVLSCQDSLHVHTVDNVLLVQTHNVLVQDTVHVHTTDSVPLTQTHILLSQDTLHSHTVDNVSLTQTYVLSLAECIHTLSSDNVSVDTSFTAIVSDSNHVLSSDNIDAVSIAVLLLQDTVHSLGSDNIALTHIHILQSQDTLHAHLADTVVFPSSGDQYIEADQTISVFSKSYQSTSDAPDSSQITSVTKDVIITTHNKSSEVKSYVVH